MNFIDTNYFLRFLLKDAGRQFVEVEKLFLEGAQGKVQLFTSLVVFFELYWVLASYYQFHKKDVIKMLKKILELSFIEFVEAEVFQKALTIFGRHKVDLEDAFDLVFAKERGALAFKTFDGKLSKLWSKKGKFL